MPGRKHLTGKVSAKAQRAYEHILASGERYGKRAKEVAARTVRKMMSEGSLNPKALDDIKEDYKGHQLYAFYDNYHGWFASIDGANYSKSLHAYFRSHPNIHSSRTEILRLLKSTVDRRYTNNTMINPSQIEDGMWVVEDAKGQTLGVYPKDWTEEAVGEAGQGFADQYKEHVIVMKKGEEFEHAHFFPKGKKTNPKRYKNHSSLADAKVLAEKWHGRPAEEIFEVVEKEIYDTNIAVLGELVELTLIDEDGYGTPIKFDKSVLLVGTVDENNMEFVGGDQKLPLEDLGIESNKHKVNCGKVFSIVYWTDKQHLHGEPKEPIERVHEFNEESKDGNYPELVYDTRNKHMELVGGSYIVTEEGIRD